MAKKFTADDVHAMMRDLPNVRNVMTIGPMGVGKTTAIDCLGVSCGLLSEDRIGDARIASARQDERTKGCTYKATVTSMVVDSLLLHMADTPGHTEYSAELSASAPLADGAVVFIDGSKSSVPATVSQHVKLLVTNSLDPVLFANRLDVPLFVTKKSAEEMFYDLRSAVDSFNDQFAFVSSMGNSRTSVSAEKGSVIFGSAAQGWAFTVPQIAAVYASKMGMTVEAMAERIWGEHYFSPATKKWSSTAKEDSVHAFIQLVLNPIQQIAQACESAELDKVQKMMKNVGVTLKPSDLQLEGQQLFRRVMQLWLPAGPAITRALRDFVANPKEAQERRCEVLTTAPLTDATAAAIKACSPSGVMNFQCVKMVPNPTTRGRFHAIGRVYAGTLSADKCFVLADEYLPPHAEDGFENDDFMLPDAEDNNCGELKRENSVGFKRESSAEDEVLSTAAGTPNLSTNNSPVLSHAGSPTMGPKHKSRTTCEERRVQSVMVCAAKTFTAVNSVPAGNMCCVSGIDQFIQKRCTLSTSKDTFPFRKPALLVSPVVRVSLQPKSSKELPKLVEGLRRLGKSCPLVEMSQDISGLYSIGSCGQEHMRILKHDLEEDYLPGVDLKWDDPSVAYRETVTHESTQMCLSKSPNRHNRLFVKADPLSEEVCLAIESNRIFPTQDAKVRAKILDKEFGWDKADAVKIWGFGPAPEESDGNYGANVLMDRTKGIQHLHEIRESTNAGLLWATKQGPICEEPMRGVRFCLYDCKLHSDTVHRGMGQIQPTARRVFYAATMTAGCRLVEPMFKADIEASFEASSGIMQALGVCRGELVLSEERGPNVVVEAFVPIAETIGTSPFATVLSQKTNGKASVSYNFDHWSTMPSDPLDYDAKKGIANSKAAEIMLGIRARKGLKVEAPVLSDYLDKL
eukprot:TRINITY_DN28900_c0_g1_i1.p1 TRINITY_DN28900_c0_g1~~TRINITY_DN28900_c0_g1_i1.p1  ORF type:complete len:913 (-),score=247.56 TRINITY_DN28900_c0_g1_i1:412-3150(-)